MMTYQKPQLIEHGSLTSLTLGNNTSGDIDGTSGMFGNSSDSDPMGGGCNDNDC